MYRFCTWAQNMCLPRPGCCSSLIPHPSIRIYDLGSSASPQLYRPVGLHLNLTRFSRSSHLQQGDAELPDSSTSLKQDITRLPNANARAAGLQSKGWRTRIVSSRRGALHFSDCVRAAFCSWASAIVCAWSDSAFRGNAVHSSNSTPGVAAHIAKIRPSPRSDSAGQTTCCNKLADGSNSVREVESLGKTRSVMESA